MRVFYFIVAAVFSLLAIALRFFNQPTWTAVIAIILAAIFLVLGFAVMAKQHQPDPIVLDEEQADTIRQLKSEGNHAGAIRQVQLWFRYATTEDAGRVVRELQ